MFSSNQYFKVSGRLDDIATVVDFAIRLDGKLDMMTRSDKTVHPAFQITDNGLYCIGTGSMDNSQYSKPAEGWTDYPFTYDPKIIGEIIQQWIRKQPEPEDGYADFDGGHGLGFVCFEPWDNEFMKQTNCGLTEHIRNIHECIICFKPYINYYAK